MELAKSYRADKKVLDQVRNFVKSTKGPEDKSGFVNMVFILEDDVFNIHFKKRPERYFEVLLSLSKQIMQNHDGTISVNAAPDKGSEFTLKFQL